MPIIEHLTERPDVDVERFPGIRIIACRNESGRPTAEKFEKIESNGPLIIIFMCPACHAQYVEKIYLSILERGAKEMAREALTKKAENDGN